MKMKAVVTLAQLAEEHRPMSRRGAALLPRLADEALTFLCDSSPASAILTPPVVETHIDVPQTPGGRGPASRTRKGHASAPETPRIRAAFMTPRAVTVVIMGAPCDMSIAETVLQTHSTWRV